jgi:16S rRNA (cytidine1402-2'-O)-methyltransferase
MARQRPSKNSSSASDEAGTRPGGASKPLEAGLAAGLERQLDKLTASKLAPGLYVVSTPIGNLADITVRALFTLAAADMVLCEDTRHSRKLFSAYGIHGMLQSYHDFSDERDRERILAALGEGKAVALISDAGTPLIADPGFKLVRAAIAGGFNVFAIPGASAILAALVGSGLPSDRFYFGGFLPAKETARWQVFENLRSVAGTLIFYETAGRLEGTLETLSTLFPGRPITVARELTKHYEEFLRGSAESVAGKIRETPPLGELVLLVGPGETAPATEEDIQQALRVAMTSGTLKEAVEEVAKGLGAARKTVYNLALKLRDEVK